MEKLGAPSGVGVHVRDSGRRREGLLRPTVCPALLLRAGQQCGCGGDASWGGAQDSTCVLWRLGGDDEVGWSGCGRGELVLCSWDNGALECHGLLVRLIFLVIGIHIH